ncbi:MAG: STN domain-containing protein, partial [Tannerellaceae bacterium]|nr:STN domain-containing protein [Tannerellaceae bacterium]
MKELLAEIEKKSDIRFSYIDENLGNDKDITLSVRNESIESLLNKILPGKGFEFIKTGNTIAIKKIN